MKVTENMARNAIPQSKASIALAFMPTLAYITEYLLSVQFWTFIEGTS